MIGWEVTCSVSSRTLNPSSSVCLSDEYLCVRVCVRQAVPTRDKEVTARLRNCILALADQNMMLYDTSVMYAYEASAHYQVEHCTIVAGKM